MAQGVLSWCPRLQHMQGATGGLGHPGRLTGTIALGRDAPEANKFGRGSWVVLSSFLSSPTFLSAPLPCNGGLKCGCHLFPGQLHICVLEVLGHVQSGC